MIKARLLLNSEIFIKENHYNECAILCQEILDNKYGTYSIVDDYRSIYSMDIINCPEVVMAFALSL